MVIKMILCGIKQLHVWSTSLHLQDSVGSQQLLANAESYGQYVVKALMNDNIQTGSDTEKLLMRENIGRVFHTWTAHIINRSYIFTHFKHFSSDLSAKIIDKNKSAINDILFPREVKDTSREGVAQTRIPAELQKERGAGGKYVCLSK